MKIDNFDIIRQHLTFEPAMKFDANTKKLKQLNDTYDRYIIHIINRAKDVNGKAHGVNTSNRLIKTYEVSSLDYFDRKRGHIIDLCESNHARAYILPQVRSTYDCIKEMIKLAVDNLENPTIKFQHILRSCTCSMHKSRDKMWILDLDSDSMTERIYNSNTNTLTKKTWTPTEVMEMVRNNLSSCGKDPLRPYFVPTKSGCHIVTPPFNLQKAFAECSMMFEGEHKVVDDIVWTGPGEYELKWTWTTGWLHKDGMTLLYCPEM